MSGNTTNPLEMSDEDFLKMNGPAEEPTQVEEEEQAKDTGQVDEEVGADEGNVEAPEDSDGSEAGETSDTDSSADAGDKGAGSEEEPNPNPTTPETGAKEEQGKADEAGADRDSGKAPKAETADPNGIVVPTDTAELQSFYKQIMTPFKANGKTISLKDPSEAISLMQMGANYTKKLQDIQPHRKVLLMLQNNDLLDEGKLSFLIDLDKKDPEAIKKLVKDAGIDPMDIDTSTESEYQAGNHSVSDEEAKFRDTLSELTSHDTGKDTLRIINERWDQASKELLWQHPEVMTIIHEQRENGIYDLIANEVDRQTTLGQIPPGTPFLEAYRIVGDTMTKSGAFAHQNSGQAPAVAQQPPMKVAEQVAVPKPKVTNGEQASAASPPRGSNPKQPQKLVNPLAMSDDEFLSKFNGRL